MCFWEARKILNIGFRILYMLHQAFYLSLIAFVNFSKYLQIFFCALFSSLDMLKSHTIIIITSICPCAFSVSNIYTTYGYMKRNILHNIYNNRKGCKLLIHNKYLLWWNKCIMKSTASFWNLNPLSQSSETSSNTSVCLQVYLKLHYHRYAAFFNGCMIQLLATIFLNFSLTFVNKTEADFLNPILKVCSFNGLSTSWTSGSQAVFWPVC